MLLLVQTEQIAIRIPKELGEKIRRRVEKGRKIDPLTNVSRVVREVLEKEFRSER
jgi:Arc/MetJ-type ribon-helix-helix transcriptional regulator